MVVDAMRTYLDAASGLTELSRRDAVAAAKVLIRHGGEDEDGGGRRIRELADELVEVSRSNRGAIADLVRAEVAGALDRMDVVPRADYERLARRVAELERRLSALRTPPRTAVLATRAAAVPAPAGAEAAEEFSADGGFGSDPADAADAAPPKKNTAATRSNPKAATGPSEEADSASPGPEEDSGALSAAPDTAVGSEAGSGTGPGGEQAGADSAQTSAEQPADTEDGQGSGAASEDGQEQGSSGQDTADAADREEDGADGSGKGSAKRAPAKGSGKGSGAKKKSQSRAKSSASGAKKAG